MSRSSELVKYLSEKVTTLSSDLSGFQPKDGHYFLVRAIVEILVIQTQTMIAIYQELKKEKDDG